MDAWLPEYDEAEQHEIVVAASVDDTWRTLRSTDFARSPVVRVLLGIRGLGTAAADLNSMVERGFTLLEEHSPHEITLGTVGRPHRSSIDRVAAEEFRAYAVPGSVRIVWDFTVEAVGEGSRIRTITRIQVKRIGRARLTRWFQHHTRKAWGPERAGVIVAAAEATIELWGRDGLDYEALAADIACEATIALVVSEQIALLDRRIRDLYAEADPDGIMLSVPGVGNILAGQILGRFGDPHRFTSLAAARSFTGLIPRRNASGLSDHAGGPTKKGDACLRAALFQAADRARKVDPQLAARYQRLMCDTAKHHNSATCTIATVLLTQIVSCLRNGTHYQLRDVDGRPISDTEGRAIVTDRYQIPPEIRAARRSISNTRSTKRRDERVTKGVAQRSKTPPVPTPA